jgi:lysophospholipase L1-like esterase
MSEQRSGRQVISDISEMTVTPAGGTKGKVKDKLADASAAAAAASASATAAQSAKVAAETARDAANATGKVYPDTAAGVAAEAEGAYFNVPSALASETLILYRKESGVAVEKKRLLNVNLGVVPGKNKFDAAAVTEGYEVLASGAVSAHATSSVSDFIDVSGQTSIAVSGLVYQTDFSHFYVFLDSDKATVVGTGAVDWYVTSKVIAVPVGADWFRISPRQHNASTDYSATQIEVGLAWTAYEPFTPRVLAVNSMPVGPAGALTTADVGTAPGKNLFDPAAITEGAEVFGDGSIAAHPQSSVSGFIDVEGQSYVSMSGLTANPAFGKFYVFLGADQTSVVGTGSLPFGATSGSAAVPAGAHWFRFSPRQRSATVPDYSTVQVEHGSITAFEPFALRVSEVGGFPVGASTSGSAASSNTNVRYLIFGDSITETATVLDDGTYTEGFAVNWPTYFGANVGATAMVNYAKSGAAYRDRTGLTSEWQKISHQVTKAIEHGKSADVVIVAAGTNDGITNLGAYLTAMGKTTLESLDRTNLYEALRWAFWTIRNSWPAATCFAALPIQRALNSTNELAPLYEAIEKMAGVYNFIVIPATWESGIVRQFEALGVAGRDLYDGLHPNANGKQKMARLFARAVRNAMNY